MLKSALCASAAATSLLVAAIPAQAQTALDKAISEGQRLSADEISGRIVNRTVTARAGDRTFVFYYGTDNTLTGRMVGGSWSDSGYYGITDNDQVCLSMTSDKGRLRCMSLIAQDGIVQKFNANGELTFELLSFELGNKL
ncbi:MAG: hypothetical protein AAGB11_13810 [Pseudomonadota bacterium]